MSNGSFITIIIAIVVANLATVLGVLYFLASNLSGRIDKLDDRLSGRLDNLDQHVQGLREDVAVLKATR